MEPRQLARILGFGRVAIGAALVIAPSTLGRRWIGAVAETEGTRIALRALGVRDLAIGAGLLDALERGHPVERWIEAGIAADAVDGVASALGGGRRAALVVLTAASGAALGGYLRRTLGEGDD